MQLITRPQFIVGQNVEEAKINNKQKKRKKKKENIINNNNSTSRVCETNEHSGIYIYMKSKSWKNNEDLFQNG